MKITKFDTIRALAGFISLLSANIVYASGNPTIGEIAAKLNISSALVAHFLHFICVVIGIGFIIMALSFYKAHRENPKFMPIERPIAYIFLGLVLISVPFLGKLFGAVTGNPADAEKHKTCTAHMPIQDVDTPLNTWYED